MRFLLELMGQNCSLKWSADGRGQFFMNTDADSNYPAGPRNLPQTFSK